MSLLRKLCSNGGNGELKHIKSLRFWGLDDVLKKKYKMNPVRAFRIPAAFSVAVSSTFIWSEVKLTSFLRMRWTRAESSTFCVFGSHQTRILFREKSAFGALAAHCCATKVWTRNARSRRGTSRPSARIAAEEWTEKQLIQLQTLNSSFSAVSKPNFASKYKLLVRKLLTRSTKFTYLGTSQSSRI